MNKPKRVTQHQRQKRRGGKLAQVKPQQRPLMAVQRFGVRADEPIICGEVDEQHTAVLVETTGMVYGIRKGEKRWVIGSHVEAAITCGGFVVLEGPPPAPEPRPTRLPDGSPGSAPELPGRIDQWHVGFTICVHCDERPAEPGQEWCSTCLADAAGETPLQRALREAGE